MHELASPILSGRAAKAPQVAAVLISQHTAPLVAGFRSPRSFLEWVGRTGVRHARVGKDVLVIATDLVAALGLDATGEDAPVDEPSESASVDNILSLVGRRRAGGGS